MATRARNAAKFATTALLIMTLQGCAFTFEVPLDREKWGALSGGTANDCPDLTGTFRVVGEATETRLLLWFLPVQWRRKPEQDVRLDRDLRLLLDESRSHALAIADLSEIAFTHMDAAHLQVTLHYEDARTWSTEPESLTFVRRSTSRDARSKTIEVSSYEFDCEKGMLAIRGRGGAFPDRDPTFRDVSRKLGRLQDGALAVSVGRADIRVPLFYHAYGWTWHRYDEVPSPHPSAQDNGPEHPGSGDR